MRRVAAMHLQPDDILLPGGERVTSITSGPWFGHLTIYVQRPGKKSVNVYRVDERHLFEVERPTPSAQRGVSP